MLTDEFLSQDEIEALLNALEPRLHESKYEKASTHIDSSTDVLNQFIRSKIKDLIKEVVDICEIKGTTVTFTNEGFDITTKYKIPDDFSVVYDKNNNVLSVGDKVKVRVYYGMIDGVIVDMDIISKRIYVKSSSGDVFTIKAHESEKITDVS